MKRILFVVAILAVYAFQAGGQTNTTAPAFEVAAIRLHDPQPHERSHIYNSATDGNFKTVNVSLLAIVQFAYAIPDSRIMDVPGWMKTQPFDIEAKSDDSVNEFLGKLSSEEAKPLKLAMIQKLLGERFKLNVHRETRVLPVYEMLVSKGGSKLAATKSNGLMINHYYNRLNAQGITVAGLAQEMASNAGRVIVDKTGIDGRFDIDLHWTPDDSVAATGTAPDAPPPLFTAFEEQLGLKLVAAKGPVEVLVIDHVEMPSAN